MNQISISSFLERGMKLVFRTYQSNSQEKALVIRLASNMTDKNVPTPVIQLF